jgi:hypothetical protein
VDTSGARDNILFDHAALHHRFDGAWMVNNGYDHKMAMDVVSQGRADLVRRLFEDAPLNALMAPETFYGGGAHGHPDYHALDGAVASGMIVEPDAAGTEELHRCFFHPEDLGCGEGHSKDNGIGKVGRSL